MQHNNLSHLVHNSWLIHSSKAFDYFKSSVVPYLNKVAETEVVFPAVHNIFRSLKELPYENVRVVILAQDPYHDFGSAIGLAFDNPKSRKPSPSLRNILREIESDTKTPSISGENQLSYLEHLPSQGVLLLNTALTVEKGKPGSHLAIWDPFSKELITSLNKSNSSIVWVLWGKKAQTHKTLITNSKHHIITGAHPSPFSARAGFFGGKFFTQINSFLKQPIKW